MMYTCPNGHRSETDDFCDLCGAALSADSASSDLAPTGVLPAVPLPASAGPDEPTRSVPADVEPGAEADPVGGGDAPDAPDAATQAFHADLSRPTQPCPHCQGRAPADALFCELCGYDFTTGTAPRSAALTEVVPAQPVEGHPGQHQPVQPHVVEPGQPHAVEPAQPAQSPPWPARSEPDAKPEPVVPAGAENPSHPSASAAETIVVPALQPTQPADDTPPVSPTAAPVEWVAEVWIDPAWYEGQQTTHQVPNAGPPQIVPLTSRSILIGRRSTTRGILPDIDCSSDPGVSRRHAQLTFDGARWFIEDLDSSNGTFVTSIVGTLPEIPVARSMRTEVELGSRIYVGAWTRISIRPPAPNEQF